MEMTLVSSKGFCTVFICFICLLVCIFILNNGADMEYYKVMINDNETSYYVIEDTKITYIEDVLAYTISNKEYLNNNLLEINTKNVQLNISSFKCTNSKSRIIDCKPFYEINKVPNLIESDYLPTSLTIFYDEQEVYNGIFINDISDYIKENGRYYFIVTYNNSNKNTKLLFSVNIEI
jgi:hypothetical protein